MECSFTKKIEQDDYQTSHQWEEFAITEELIVEPGEYRISIWKENSSIEYKCCGWGNYGDRYQSFHMEVLDTFIIKLEMIFQIIITTGLEITLQWLILNTL